MTYRSKRVFEPSHWCHTHPCHYHYSRYKSEILSCVVGFTHYLYVGLAIVSRARYRGDRSSPKPYRSLIVSHKDLAIIHGTLQLHTASATDPPIPGGTYLICSYQWLKRSRLRIVSYFRIRKRNTVILRSDLAWPVTQNVKSTHEVSGPYDDS
jgi:hypothetical protein